MHVDRLEPAFFAFGANLPDRDPGRVQRVVRAFHRPGGDDVFAAVGRGAARQVLQHQIVRFAHLRLHHAGRVRPVDPCGDADFAVGDQIDHGAVGGHLRDLADQAFFVDDRVVFAHPRGAALVDPDRRVPDVRRLGDDGGGHRTVVVEAELIEVVERQQFVVAVPIGALGDQLPCAGCRSACALPRAGLWRAACRRTSRTGSRTGFSALFAPSWIGETTVRKPRCTECRPPSGDSPK